MSAASPISAPHGLPPERVSDIPGPRSRALAARLGRAESRNVTCSVPNPPIFWERAAGVNVWDVDANRFVDLGGAFGVACVGHSHPRVVAAIADQAGRLLHGMGDVHPPAVKVELLEELTSRYPGGAQARGVLVSSGSDAVETALKTAQLATGRSGVVAFEGAYHGLSLGALDATWRADFREPFAGRLPGATVFARYGAADDVARAAAASATPIGAVLVEPIQGRGGERVPPVGFLHELREVCDREGWLLIVDEVYTGAGRTGRFWACEHEQVVPDLLCGGKGLASGMPLSVCLGRREVMDHWPVSQGEALHTQTFLGHPASCAAALASLAVIEDEELVRAAAGTGAALLGRLREASLPGVTEVRGRGLMIGVECESPERAIGACLGALERGFILLPSGDDSRVLSITPPLTIGMDLLELAIEALADALAPGRT